MIIEFTGKTNKDYCRVNLAYFKLKSGSVVGIDREDTEYNINEDGTFAMTWLNCYLWSIDDCFPFAEPVKIDEISFLRGADFLYLELEDDTDKDYEVTIDTVDWSYD